MFQLRDICTHAFFQNVDDDKVILLVDQSYSIPTPKGYIRGGTNLSGIYFKALSPTSSQVIGMFDNDPKGLIPKWIINLLVADVAKGMVRFKEMIENGVNLDKYPINYKTLKEVQPQSRK